MQSLWRYPVKSMQGESCGELGFGVNGVEGDRRFGVLDLGSGTIVSAKRDGRLLEAQAALVDGDLRVTLPSGQQFEPGDVLDECLTHWLGRPVRLVDSASYGVATFESPEDFEHDDSRLEQWEGIAGSFVDDSALHVLAASDLRRLECERPDLQWEVRRFRPNVVIEEDPGTWSSLEPGQRLLVGEVEIEYLRGCKRCVMTTRPQREDLERQLDILRHVIKEHDNTVGERANVVRPGVVRVGDPVSLVG
ncbi:MAG: MOSC domain-containing protein [Acidimicrobiales bacterium]